MAIEKSIDPRGYFILILSALPLIASTNIDCNGRPFYCVNSTHFMICVDFGGGLSSTMDDYILACPEPTVCDKNNLYECEFPLGTTETGSPQGSSFTTPSTTMGTTWSEATINTINPTTSTDFQTSASTDMNVTNQFVNQNNATIFPETTTEPFTKETASIMTTSNEILYTKIKSSTDASMTTESINTTESYSLTNSDNWTKPKTSTSHSMHASNSNDTTVVTDSNFIYSSPAEVTTKRTIVGETITINSTVNDKVTTESSDFSQITSNIQPVDGTLSSTTSSDNIQTSNNIGEPIVNINLNTTSDSLSEVTTEILINKITNTNGFKTDATKITKHIVDNTKVTTEASDVSQLFSTNMSNNSTKLEDSTLSSSADGLKTDVTNTMEEEAKVTTETNNISELITTTTTNLPITPIGSTLNSITSSDNIQISNSNMNESTITTNSNTTSDLLSEVTTEGSINNTTNSKGFMTDITNTIVNDSKVTTEASDVSQSFSTITSNINTPIVTVHLIITSESLPEVTTETLITKITSIDGFKDSSPNITNATIDAKSTTEVKNASQLFSTIMSNTSIQPIDITPSAIPSSDNINSSITNIYESITLTNDNVTSTLLPEVTTEGIIDKTTTVDGSKDSSPNNTNTTANDTKDTTEVNNATQLFSTIRSNSSIQPIDITTSSIFSSGNINSSITNIYESITLTNDVTSTLLPEVTTERIINIITSTDRRTDITNNIPNNINVTREASKDSMLTSTTYSDNIKVTNTNVDEPIITTDFNASSNSLQMVTTEGLNKITNAISSTTDVTLITTPMDSDKNATANMVNTLTQVVNSSLTSITPSDNIQTTNTNIGGPTTAAELNATTASLPKVTTGMINKITSVDSSNSNEQNIMVNNSKITTEPNGIFGLFSTTTDGILEQPIDSSISSTRSYDNIQMTNVTNTDKPIIINSSNSIPVVPPEVSRTQTTSSDSVQTFIGFVDQVTTVRSMSNDDDANLTSYVVSDSNPIGESNNNDLSSTTYSEMSTQKPIMNPVSLKNSNNIHASTLNIGNPVIIKESNETANVTTAGIISTVDFTNKEVLNVSNVTTNGSQATTYRNNVVDLLSHKTNDLQTKPISVTSSMTISDQLQITNKVDVLTATDSYKPVLSSQYTTTLTTLTSDVVSEIKTPSELTSASELFRTSPTNGKTVITFNPSKSSDYSYSANMNGDMNNFNVHKNSNLKPSLSPDEKTDGLMSSVDQIHQELSTRSLVSNYTEGTTKTTTIDLFSIIMKNTDANTLMSTDSNLIQALPTTNMVSLISTNTNNISDPTNIIPVSTINNNSNSKPNIETISTFVNIEPRTNLNSAIVPETTTERLFNVIHTASNDVLKIHSTVMSDIKQFTRIPDLNSSNWEKSTISPVNPATTSVYSLLLVNNVTNSISTESNIKSIFDEKPAKMSSVDFTPNELYTIYNNPITEIFESSVITIDAKKNSTITTLNLNDLKDSDINTTQATITRYSNIINNLSTKITTESPDYTKTTTIDPVTSKVLNSLKISDPEVIQKSITQYISSPSKSTLSYKLYASSADMRQPAQDTNTYMPPNFLPGGRTTISKDPREVSQSPRTLIENLFSTNSRILKPGKWKRMGANSDEETVSTDNKTLAVSDTEEVTTSRPVEKLTHSSHHTPAPKHDLTGIGTTMSDQIRYSNGFYSTKKVESTTPLILVNTNKALHTTAVSEQPKNSLHKQSPISEIETTINLPAIIGSYHKMGNRDKVESTNIHDSSISEDDEHEQAIIMHTSNKKHSTSLNKIGVTSTNFDCTHRNRGRYADSKNCTKLYICIGQRHPIIGACPANTVFSETWKQCTNNLSHCVRNNQFRCMLEGRFADLIQDNVYYICVKNGNNSFFRVKLQCLVGYHLNKATLKCDLNEEDKSQSESMNTSVSKSDTKSISDESKASSKPELECYKEGVFPDPTDSTRYYVCTKYKSQYRKKKKKCHTDEVFHKDKKRCVDADSNEH